MSTAVEDSKDASYIDPRPLLEALDAPALVIDARGAIRCRNEPLERLLEERGAPLLPLSPGGAHLLLPPAPEASGLARLTALLSGEIDRAELDLPGDGSGAPRWSLVAVPCAVGAGRGALIRLIDLAERRAREHQRRCAQIIASLPVGCAIHSLDDPADDRSLRCLYVNAAAEQISRKPAGEVVGRTMDENFPRLRDIGVPQRFAELIRSGRTVEDEELLPPDGSARILTATAFPLGERCLAVLYDDITQRRATEASLAGTRALLDAIIDNLPLMLFVKDAKELRYVRVNRKFEEFFGYAPGELVGKCASDSVPQHVAERLDAESRLVLAAGVPVEKPELPLPTRPRGTRIIHARWIPMKDSAGVSRYLLGISEDITERKKIEDAKRHEEILLATQRRLLELIRELSMPSIPIHPGILVVPLIGQMDNSRGAQLTESLVGAIERHQAEFVLIDITGVTAVDSAVAGHLLQATRAAGLLGAECSVVGASPQTARTVVELGLELGKLTTHRDLGAGFRYALARKGYVIAPRAARTA
ncbi:PAS domain-containing protein [Sorangium sp. So ce131]|uniref:PAS domain-containing protein n=1 Tax=Sorangium sp. So ce131 TaxID=3133282 RepID=UPI003F61A853